MSPARPFILVVEDNANIRALSSLVLKSAGYQVLEASSADDALVLLDARNDVVLVFSDIQMPGSMSGIELAHYLHIHHEKLLVILTSNLPIDQHVSYPPQTPFLEKPYSHHELLKAVSERLALSLA